MTGHSLRTQLLVGGLLFQGILLAGYILVSTYLLKDGITANLTVSAKSLSNILNLAISPYAVDNKLPDIQDYLRELTDNDDYGLVYVVILDEFGHPRLEVGDIPEAPLSLNQQSVEQALAEGVRHQQQRILLSNNAIGTLQFGLATGGLAQVLERMLRVVLILNFSVFCLAALILSLFSQQLGRRLGRLMQATDTLAAGHYHERVKAQGNDEFSRLAQNFNRMAEAVAAREKQFASVFNAAPLPMLLISEHAQQLHLLQVNYAAEQQFAEQTLKQIVDNDSSQVREHMAESPGKKQHEVLLPVIGSQEHAFLLSTQRYDLDGEVRHIIALTDVQPLRNAQLELLTLNNNLEQRIQQRTTEVARRNEELADALMHLQHMQTQLVQADKLSSLGSIVAAVAHELNTPIGNALTVASTLQDLNKEFSQSLGQGLRRSVLDEFQDNSVHAADLLIRNLQRAAELIRSFKGVAVDRTSSQRRDFELADVVHETLTTLAPTLKHRPYRVDSHIPAGIHLNSYPGPLGQIISNLINNCIVHAFAGREHGVIRIEATPLGNDRVRVVISDDGCGIPREHLKRIFDPFFTTRLGQGGSGLGLNIVYNLTTSLLGGSVEVDSQPGSGSRFIFNLPLTAPAHSETEHD